MTDSERLALVDRAYAECAPDMLESRLLEILRECGEECGEASYAYAAMLSEMGGFYRGRTDFEKAERYFLRAAEILREVSGERSADRATVLNNLAGTYRMEGRFAEAEKLLHEVMELYAETVGEKHVLYASALNYLALTYLDERDFPRAEDTLARASKILAELPGCRDEYASSLCTRGALLLQTARNDEAEKLLTEAVELYDTSLGHVTAHYHAALNSLGIVYFQRKDYEKALGYFEKAYAAAEKYYGEYHAETQGIRDALALTRRKLEEKA